MNNEIAAKLSDPGLSIDDLREYSNKTNEINRIIAGHPNVDGTLLDEILEFWGENNECVDSGVIAIALKSPSISLDKAVYFGRDYPEAILGNPSFAEILKKNPDLYKRIPELLHQINCPEKLLLKAAKQKKEEYWPNILINPDIPISVTNIVSPKVMFEAAKQRLNDFADKVTDGAVKEYLSLYSETVRPFCVPRFLKFDRDLPDHRLSDQGLCGFPFTSQKWPWPVGSNGLHMQPVAQINLENAGNLLGLPLGTGLLQIWGCVGMGLRDHSIRSIPTADLSDSLDNFYPSGAPWLKTDDDGSPLFENCIVSSFTLDDYRPFKIENCRVEWIDMGDMFYPSVYKRIFSALHQDIHDQNFDDEDDSVMLAEKLDEKLRKLRKLCKTLTSECYA